MGPVGVEVATRTCAFVETDFAGEFAVAVGADLAWSTGVAARSAICAVGIEVATRTPTFAETELAGEFAIAVGADFA